MAAAEAAAAALTAQVAAEAATTATPATAAGEAEAAAAVRAATLEAAAVAAEPPAVQVAPRRPRPPRKRPPGRPTRPPPSQRRRSGPPSRVPGGVATNQARARRRRPPKAARLATKRRLAAEAAQTPHASHATRVRSALQECVDIGAPPWVLRVLKYGYQIPWLAKPPQHRRRAYPQPPADLAFSHKTADDWVAHGFVRALDAQTATRAPDVSPYFVVHHPKDRLVVDLSTKNDHMADRPFAYDNLPRFAAQLMPGDHLISWDISDAFMHIPMSPASGGDVQGRKMGA